MSVIALRAPLSGSASQDLLPARLKRAGQTPVTERHLAAPAPSRRAELSPQMYKEPYISTDADRRTQMEQTLHKQISKQVTDTAAETLGAPLPPSRRLLTPRTGAADSHPCHRPANLAPAGTAQCRSAQRAPSLSSQTLPRPAPAASQLPLSSPRAGGWTARVKVVTAPSWFRVGVFSLCPQVGSTRSCGVSFPRAGIHPRGFSPTTSSP